MSMEETSSVGRQGRKAMGKKRRESKNFVKKEAAGDSLLSVVDIGDNPLKRRSPRLMGMGGEGVCYDERRKRKSSDSSCPEAPCTPPVARTRSKPEPECALATEEEKDEEEDEELEPSSAEFKRIRTSTTIRESLEAGKGVISSKIIDETVIISGSSSVGAQINVKHRHQASKVLFPEERPAPVASMDMPPSLESSPSTKSSPSCSEGGLTMSSVDIEQEVNAVARLDVNKKESCNLSQLKESPGEEHSKRQSKEQIHQQQEGHVLRFPHGGGWDPTDPAHVLQVKTALHLSAVPETILCRDSEQATVIEFCRGCVTEGRAGSIYICGCPGTGKTLTMEKVKLLCGDWSREAGTPPPQPITINCTSLTDPRHIYLRLLQALRPPKAGHEARDLNGGSGNSKSHELVMKELKAILCGSSSNSSSKSRSDNKRHGLVLLVVDEIDYLITRDQSVLYDLFRLPTFLNSRLVLVGVANAIDLTERLLPKLRGMAMGGRGVDVVTFPTYNEGQILAVLQQRLRGLPHAVFQPAALELCARRVAAAAGDMRKALHVCRSAVELVEAEARAVAAATATAITHAESKILRGEFVCGRGELDSRGGRSSMAAISRTSSTEAEAEAEAAENSDAAPPAPLALAAALVRIDTMAKALSRVFKSPVVETIQALPRQQQMVLCAAVRRHRQGKRDSNMGELNAGYLEFCKLSGMHPLAGPEFSMVCQVLADQALLSVGSTGSRTREDRLRRVALKVDHEDVAFALQGIRFFQTCLH